MPSMPTPHHDGDHRHDLGLAFDLGTLRQRAARLPQRLDRRRALFLFGASAAGLALAACGAGSSSSSSTGSSTSTTVGAGAAGGAPGQAGASEGSSADAAIPEETAGPYPADGSNGPNVLEESGVVRQDITSSFGPYSGTATGVPLAVDLTMTMADSGEPLAGAAVYLWHCDREGRYSLYSSGATEENHLRGVQEADADGRLRFTSIFPGAYAGRWPHLHFEVFPDLDEATTTGSRLVTSQIALPEAACVEAYATSGYEQSVANLAPLSLETDGIFADGYELELAEVTGNTSSGMTATLTVPV